MLSARRTGRVVAFPELAAARGRAARREAWTNLVLLLLAAAVVGFVFLVFQALLGGLTWLGSTVWHYLPSFIPSPDALLDLLL